MISSFYRSTSFFYRVILIW